MPNVQIKQNTNFINGLNTAVELNCCVELMDGPKDDCIDSRPKCVTYIYIYMGNVISFQVKSEQKYLRS